MGGCPALLWKARGEINGEMAAPRRHIIDKCTTWPSCVFFSATHKHAETPSGVADSRMQPQAATGRPPSPTASRLVLTEWRCAELRRPRRTAWLTIQRQPTNSAPRMPGGAAVAGSRRAHRTPPPPHRAVQRQPAIVSSWLHGLLVVTVLWHAVAGGTTTAGAAGGGRRVEAAAANNAAVDGSAPPPLPPPLTHTPSRCLAAVRNTTYAYKQWDNGCRELIGKGFKCFDVDALVLGLGEEAEEEGGGSGAGEPAVASSDSPTRRPVFIKLHKVGGTTLGDVLARATGQLKSCAPSLGNLPNIGKGRTMSCDWCCGGHQGKNVYEKCGPLPFNSLCTPLENQVSVTLLRNPLDRFFSMYFFQMEEQGSVQERKQLARIAFRVGYFQGFNKWIGEKLSEANNGHLFFEPTFAKAYASTCRAFPGCCALDANLTAMDKALAMLDDIRVVGLTEAFDDSVVLLALELGWDPASLAFSDADKKRVSSKKSRIDMAQMPLHIRLNITSHPLFQRELALYNHGRHAFQRLKAKWAADTFAAAKARYLEAKQQLAVAAHSKHL